MPLDFGTPMADYTPPSESFDADDVWIKPLKDGDNTIRFVQPMKDWMGYREHFDGNPAVKRYFPCTEDSSCPGCKSPAEEVRRRSRRVICNAINGQGYQLILKLPQTLYDDLEDRAKKVRADRGEEITDRDFLLVRKGSGLDTKYRFEPLDKTPFDFTGELYDLKEALSNQYMKYLEKLAGDEGRGDEAAHEADLKPADEAQNRGWEEPTFTTEAGDATPGAQQVAAENEPVEDWPTSRMKAWLDKKGIEYPLRASKNTLIGLIEDSREA